MPPVSIKYVVSFSSQDDRHPVSNIVKSDGFKKWLCHPQEKSGQVDAVFQLEQPCVISYIDIGSIWCATLEVKVGRSEWPAGRDFETLAYTVSLMSPADCLNNRNPNKTQMFSADLFCSDVAEQEWDRIKVVCRQPYKKMTQYGLSFLRIKSMSSLPKTLVEKKQASDATSVKDIQNHFLGKLENSKDQISNLLKTRLLKIAASSDDGGVENASALSRTAKLVLAASGNKPKSYSNPSSVPACETNRLYSSRVEQNYGKEFVEDVADFLNNLVLDPKDLENFTLADVRHKLERKKKRKLTKDEKKIFIEEATKYLTSVFKDKKTITPEKRNVANKDSLLKGTKVESAVRNEAIIHKDIVRQNNGVAETNKSRVKRKLENDCATPPPCKMINNNKTPVSVIQKMKSFDSNASCTVKRDMIGDLKKLEQNGPIKSCVTSPGTPYQYKGLRGGEREKTVSCAKKNSSSSNTGISRDSISFVMSSDDSSVDDDIDMMLADNRKRTMGKTRGRGKGRGRGQEDYDNHLNSSDQKNSFTSKNEDPPWLSAKPLVSSKSQLTNQSKANTNSGRSPGNGHMGSPPWLLAAETRLQQQKKDGKTTTSSVKLGTDSKSSDTKALNSSNHSVHPSCVTSSSAASRHKYEQSNTGTVQSQSLLRRKSSGKPNSGKHRGGASKNRRSSGVAKISFTSFDISDDSDDGDIKYSNAGAKPNDNDDMVNGMVQCPLCSNSFPRCAIEIHAATCYL